MKSGNDVDKYAMAVMKKDSVVGHLWEEKWKVRKNSVLFRESRCYQFAKNDNKGEGCEQKKRNGNVSSMCNNIHW